MEGVGQMALGSFGLMLICLGHNYWFLVGILFPVVNYLLLLNFLLLPQTPQGQLLIAPVQSRNIFERFYHPMGLNNLVERIELQMVLHLHTRRGITNSPDVARKRY